MKEMVSKQKKNFLSLDKIGLKRGDIVWVASDIRRICIRYRRMYKEELSPDDIINELKEIVGDDGTLLFPTFNWDFCHGKAFDYNHSIGQTGTLGNVALKRDDFSRTQHPIYSFAVCGKYKEELVSMSNISSFSEDSPFGWLNRKKAKMLALDVPILPPDYGFGYTFVHYVEQQSGNVKYRYEKEFTAPYIDINENKSLRTYSMFVRDLDLDVRNRLIGIYLIMSELGVMTKYQYNDITYRIIDLHASVALVHDDILYNKSRGICIYRGQD